MLTICSVFHSEPTRRLLKLNMEWSQKINSGANFHWLIADNGWMGFKDKLDSQRFTVIDGAEKNLPGTEIRQWAVPSHRLALGWQKLIPYVKTRFVLFLDPDFYIVRPHWMREIPEWMQKRGLALFSVPWHPKHLIKYRYFPAQHSLFIDLERLPFSKIDLMPQHDFLHPRGATDRFVKSLKFALGERVSIGMSQEIGVKLFRKYRNDPQIRYEYAQPVFKAKLTFLDKILPDRFSFVPKQAEYFTPLSFRDRGFFDAVGEGWEEFIWKDDPFSFHIRGTDKILKNGLDKGMGDLYRILESFLPNKTT